MKGHKLSVTLIDDNPQFARLFTLAAGEALEVRSFQHASLALEHLRASPPHAILLDLHMPDMDGFSVCNKIRQINPSLPVFFLTDDRDVNSLAQGLKLATDYFPKSMEVSELVVRIASKVAPKTEELPEHTLRCRELVMDTAAHRVWACGKEIKLTPKQYDILLIFMQNQNKLLRKQDLLDQLWEGVHVDATNIDTHLFHLRKKFGGLTQGIETRKGLGYILRSD